MFLKPVKAISKTLLISILVPLSVFSSNNLDRDQIQQRAMANHQPLSYREARKVMFGDLYLEEDNQGYYVRDVYCQMITRNGAGPGLIPDHHEINTEHSWPQSKFSDEFSHRTQKTDLHHLFPTNSRANSSRSNIIYAEVTGRAPTAGCESSAVGNLQGQRAFYPPEEIRGDVARALFYFSVRYNTKISDLEEFYLRQWYYLDPVDEFEIERHEKIIQAQGNSNPFIIDPDLIIFIDDF